MPRNHLTDATSPYLLQHADNPVDWYPWGDEAFEEAARRSVDYIEVNVDEGDVDALRFYRRHGFVAEEPDTGERALYLFREGTQP